MTENYVSWDEALIAADARQSARWRVLSRRLGKARIRVLEKAVSDLEAKVDAAVVASNQPIAELIRLGQDARAMHAMVYLLWRLVGASESEMDMTWLVKDACDDGGWLHVMAEHLDPNGVRLSRRKRAILARTVGAVEQRLADPRLTEIGGAK